MSSSPFYDLSRCPEADLPQPAALDLSDLVANCDVPDTPGPVFQCPAPQVPIPGVFGSVLLHIQITARTGLKHDWQAVDPNDAGGWVLNGLTGSVAEESEAYEINGEAVDPSAAVYMAKRNEASDKLTFWKNPSAALAFDNFKYIKLVAGPDGSGMYDWKEVAPDDWHDAAGLTVTLLADVPDEAGPTSISVNDTTGISAGTFFKFDSEYVAVASVDSDTTMTVARAQLGTTHAAHTSGTSGTSQVSGTAAGGDGAYEISGWNPIVDETVYQARRASTGKFVFHAVRKTYYLRLPAGPDGSHLYDWAEYEPDESGTWTATGFAKTAAEGHGAYEQAGQVVRADNATIYQGRQDGKGFMIFWAPQASFWIKLTAGPDGDKLYDWKQVEDDGAGGWSDTGVTGAAADDDGAKENQDLPAIPGDEKVYLARRAKDGTVRFNTTDANSGFLLLPPAGGGGIPVGSDSTHAGSASCELIKFTDAGVKSASGVFATVWNPYPAAQGLGASMAKPLQAKIIAGKLVVDVDPCAS